MPGSPRGFALRKFTSGVTSPFSGKPQSELGVPESAAPPPLAPPSVPQAPTQAAPSSLPPGVAPGTVPQFSGQEWFVTDPSGVTWTWQVFNGVGVWVP